MVEYGQGVGQAGQVAGSTGHAAAGGPTDVGTAFVAGLTDALDRTSATLGVPPLLLAVVALAVVLFVVWRVFAR
ncbi:MAG TPA: hypothetical protein VEY67_10360 [Candidatus Dormibacteraeota bacterium]|nr:hypothetical protein [Candidatus Dormibacteraeota bacterium]